MGHRCWLFCKGFDIVHFVNGKAVEHWGLTDNMAMMEQLGAMPPANANMEEQDMEIEEDQEPY